MGWWGSEERGDRRRPQGQPRRRRAFACGAQDTESQRRPRPCALLENPRWKRSKVSQATLQGRRARPLHANGLRGCPWGLGAQLLLSGKLALCSPTLPPSFPNPSSSTPASTVTPSAARSLSSITLLSPRHWDFVSSLELFTDRRSAAGRLRVLWLPKALRNHWVQQRALCASLEKNDRDGKAVVSQKPLPRRMPPLPGSLLPTAIPTPHRLGSQSHTAGIRFSTHSVCQGVLLGTSWTLLRFQGQACFALVT